MLSLKNTSLLLLMLASQSLFGQSKTSPLIYTTAKNTDLKLSKVAPSNNLLKEKEVEVYIIVDTLKTYQTFVGIGGAITDASAEIYASLPKKTQQELLNAYYDADLGIGYSLIRTNMNSCDFSTKSYTYVKDNDKTLSSFDIKPDQKYKIPLIKKALEKAGGNIPVYFSPWSPPAWMKDNNNMLHGGKLLPEYYQTWADYYVKFIQEYEKTGIPIWGLSVQNEPMAVQIWESCIYTSEEERDFVKFNLGPTLWKNGMKDKKVIIWDHNRDLMYERASVALRDKEAAKYIWGVGFHWYETWSGTGMNFNNLKVTQEAFPDKNLIFTEGCAEGFNKARINAWELGEKYAYSMINDFNCGTVAWTDWNILLDEKGGPNHVGNYCFAPVHADTKKGELIYTNAYWYIGHFSKFIKPGAKRVLTSSNRANLHFVAFKNPDNSVVLVLMNQTEKDVEHEIIFGDKSYYVKALARSISSVIL